MNKLIMGMILLLTVMNVQAKELQLIIKSESQYPMGIEYQFVGTNQIYAAGKINVMTPEKLYYIVVNRIPDNEDIMIKISKMSIPYVAVFNDPCEITLTGNELTANVVVGFKGDPNPADHNGAFTCNVSASSSLEK